MIRVDLPEPVEPMKATVSPRLALKLISFNMYSSASGYLNDTSLNSTVPARDGSLLVTVPSIIANSSSNTSLIRSADIAARGYMMKIMASIKNDIITCIP